MLILTGWNGQKDSLIDGTMKNNHASLIDDLGSLKKVPKMILLFWRRIH